MIKAVSKYNKEKVNQMGASVKRRTTTSSLVLSICMFFMGILYVISGIRGGAKGANLFIIIIGAVVFVASPWPIISSIKTAKRNTTKVVKELDVEENDLTIEYTIKEKRIEIKTIQNEEIKQDTIMLKNVSLIRNTKEGIAIYLNKGEMYYIDNKDFTEGNKEQLIKQFTNLGITYKKR